MISLTETQVKTLVYAGKSCIAGGRVSGSELMSASPYTIVNLTGYPLYSQRDEEFIVTIKPGMSYAVTLPAIEARQITPKLVLSIDNHTGRYKLPEMQVNMVSSTEISIGNPVGPEDFRLFCDVEMVKNRKMVKIRAPVVFKNETSHTFQVITESTWGKKSWDIEAESESALPYDCTSSVRFTLFNEDFRIYHLENLWDFLQSPQSSAHISLSDQTSHLCVHIEQVKKPVHRYVVRLLAPVIVSNALPLQCEIGLGNEGECMYERVDSKCRLISYDVRSDKPLFIRMKIPGFLETEPLKVHIPGKKPKSRVFRLTDRTNSHAEVLLSLKLHGQLLLTLHSPIIIDNTSPLPLLFHYKKTGIMHRVAGQQTDPIYTDSRQAIRCESIQIQHNYFFCCATKKLQIELNRRKSESFKIGAVGAQKVVTIEGEKGREGEYELYQLVYNVRFIWPMDDAEIYCKLVTISPRFIVNNLLSKPLLLYQMGSRKPVVLKGRTSMPWFWQDGRKQELMKISIAEVDKWDWSGTFSVSGIGSTTLQCRNKHTNDYFLIKTEIRQQDIAGLVTFQEENSAHPAYLLENYSTAFSVAFYQEGYPEFVRYAGVRTEVVYAWASSMHSHTLILRFLLGGLADFPLDLNEICRINPDDINTHRNITIKITKYKGRFVYISLFSRGSTKIIRISDDKQAPGRGKEPVIDSFAVVIPHFGLSLTENAPGRASELLYFSLHDLELEGTRTASLQRFTLSIKRIQVDNQYNPLAICPVLLSIQSSTRSPALQTQFSYYLSGETDCYSIDKGELLVQEVELQAESLVIQRLIGLYSRISEELMPPRASLAASVPMQYRTSKSIVVTTQCSSRLTQTSIVRIENIKQISFFYLKIHPILLSITFVPLKEIYESEESESFDTLITALGLPIMNIKAAPMKFYALELRNVFGARWQLVQTVSSFYGAQVASEIFSIVGHADVLGNPLGILNNLGEGVADLFYEPCKAVMENPSSAGRGLAKGVKSFFSKTIYATFGTVSKLTGTLSSGLSSLTSDHDYQMKLQKERAKNQPKDLVEGLGNGVKALVVSVSRGVTGIVEEPYRGAKEDGFLGLLKGGLKGVGGLIVKPITGLLDVASHTSQGIVNTADLLDHRKKAKRIRQPRVTYGESGVIRPFNEEDAEVAYFLIQLDRSRYLGCHFIHQVLESDAKGEPVLFVQYVEWLVLVSLGDHKVIWRVKAGDLESYVQTKYGVMLNVTGSSLKKVPITQKHSSRSEFLIPFMSEAVKSRICKRLRAAEVLPSAPSSP